MTIFEFVAGYVQWVLIVWMLMNLALVATLTASFFVGMAITFLLMIGGFTKQSEWVSELLTERIGGIAESLFTILNTIYNNIFNPIRWVYFSINLRKNIKNRTHTMKLLCQLNGVTIGKVFVEDSATEDEIKTAMLEDTTLEPFVSDAKRIVIVPTKLVNIVT